MLSFGDLSANGLPIASSKIHISFLRDTSHSLSIKEIDLIPDAYFTQLDKGNINLGRDKASIWIRMDFILKDVSEDYIIELDYSLVDFINFYYQEEGNWATIETGSQRAFVDRYLDYRFFAFPVDKNRKAQTVYFNINSENPLNFRLSLVNEKDFYHTTLNEEIGHGIFIGFLILVMLTNLIFYFALKDTSFLIYVGYMFFTLCVNMTLTGHLGKYVFSDIGGWQNPFFINVFAITVSFSIWFAHEFLNLKQEKALLKFFLVPVAFLMPFLAVVSHWIDYSAINSMFELLTLILLLVVVFTGVKRTWQGHRPAVFYVFAYLSYLICITPVILLSFNLVERNFFSVYGAELGVILEASLLSIALGYRYSDEKHKTDTEKKMVLEENLKLQKQLQSKLEKEVEQRTVELNEAIDQLNDRKEEIERQKENIEEQNKKLEKMNDDKSRFISILAHDVKGPINSLFSFAELLKNHINFLSKEELEDLGKKLGNHTKNLFSLLENLLQWSRAQMGSMDIKPENFDVTDIINANLELANLQASNKGIKLIYEEKSYIVYSDKNMFMTVLRNLLANAIKFSFSNSEIVISVENLEKEIVLKVKDSGVGISPKIQEKLFNISTKHTTSGTSGEKGTGLGLKLCKEFVNLNGGQIWVESKYGEGSSFCFTVPLADKNEMIELNPS